MSALLDIILPVFLVIGFGYGVARKNFLSQAAVDGLMKYAVGIAVPCLLFLAISRIDLESDFNLNLLASFYLGAFTGFSVAFLGARYLFHRDLDASIAIGFCGFFSNTVMLGLPITERAFGDASLPSAYAILSLHALITYGVGITLMELVRSRKNSAGKGLAAAIFSTVISNPLLIGIVLGFVVNLTGIKLPEVLVSGLSILAGSALPVALFGLGGVLVRYRPEGDKYAIGWVTFVSLVVHPSVTFALGSWVFDLNTDQLRAAVLLSSMAPGINTYLFANLYGVGKRVAASSVLVATGLSIFSIWIWLAILP